MLINQYCWNASGITVRTGCRRKSTDSLINRQPVSVNMVAESHIEKTPVKGKMKKAPKAFDWDDTDFLRDRTPYSNLDFSMFWPGVGLLIQRTQELLDTLDSCQYQLMKDSEELEPYELSNLTCCINRDKLRSSALGEVFSMYYKGWNCGIESETDNLISLIRTRNYFVSRFFLEKKHNRKTLNKALVRLKETVVLTEEFNAKYRTFMRDVLEAERTLR